MPEMNGLELAISLKSQDPTLPIVMVSGVEQPERMSPFVDMAFAKGAPIQDIMDRLQLLLAERPEPSQ